MKDTYNNFLHICCSTDDEYIQHCAVTVCSVLENSSKKFIVHILSDNINPDSERKIKELIDKYGSMLVIHKFDTTKLENAQYKTDKKSPARYARLLLSTELNSKIDKILYLDCDTVVLDDVSKLFCIDIDGYSVAAVRDTFPIIEEHKLQLSMSYENKYFNSGVLLINLKYWREHNSEKELLDFANRKRKVFFHDQDALNYVFNSTVFWLPPRWNRFSIAYRDKSHFSCDADKSDYYKNPAIIHYTDIRPWTNLYTPFKEKYYKYLNKTEFKNTPHVKVQYKLYRILIINYLYRIHLSCILNLYRKLKVLFS